MNAASVRKPPTQRRLLAVCFGVAVALAFLGSAELALRLAGFRFSPWYLAAPQFVSEADGSHVRTAAMFVDGKPYGFPFCVDQRFARVKPAGSVRIAIVGGSSVRNLGLAPYLAGQLQQRLSRPTEIINLGFGGCGSERVLLSVRETLDYQPDAVVVYAGHNEFVSFCNPATVVDARGHPLKRHSLPRLRVAQFVAKEIHSIWKPSRAMLEGRVRLYRDADKAAFYQVFRENLTAMTAAGRARGVPVVLCTVAYNYACPPEYFPTFPRMEESPGWDLPRLRAELLNHPGNALLEFLLGRRLLDAGQSAEAAKHLEQSFLQTSRPIRANAEINRIIRSVASETGAALADVHVAVAARAPNGLPGYDLLEDHCHLNNEGNRILLDTVASVLADILKRE